MQNKLDEDIVRKVVAGDQEAYGEIVNHYNEPINRYIRGILLSIHAAEDVTQETFIKAYMNLNSYKFGKKFSSWLYRIAHNESISYIRKHRREITADDDVIFERLPDERKGIEDIIDEQIQRNELVCALKSLKPKYREPLILYYMRGESYEDISDILRIPRNTVGTRINRAKKQLHEAIVLERSKHE